MIFEYEKDGEVIERDFPIGQAPRELDGGWVRVFSVPHVIGIKPTVKHHAQSTDRAPVGEHIATSLPRWTPWHKGPFTKNGKPIVRGRRDIDHIKKASGGAYVYD